MWIGFTRPLGSPACLHPVLLARLSVRVRLRVFLSGSCGLGWGFHFGIICGLGFTRPLGSPACLHPVVLARLSVHVRLGFFLSGSSELRWVFISELYVGWG